ncbi:MAG: POTRA domain-containing protein [Rhizomicrobium sp.]
MSIKVRYRLSLCIERARNDIPRLQTALNSFGYYANTIQIKIGAYDLSDPALPAWLENVASGTGVAVTVRVEQGPLYRLGTITIDGQMPDRDRNALALNSGDPAVASNVLDARQRLLSALQEDGFALAAVDTPIAFADDAQHLIDLTFKVNAGHQVDLGAITFKGLRDVNESFARRAMRLQSGERFKPSKIEDARKALMDQGVFSGRLRAYRRSSFRRRPHPDCLRRARASAACRHDIGFLFDRSRD